MENQIIKDDEIDLVALLKTIWAGRRIIYYSVAICGIVGLIIAFTSPKRYTASATLLPSVDDAKSNMGGLSSLAGLAGINIGSMMGNNTGIAPELYPQVVRSVPYLLELMHVPLVWEDYSDSMSIYEKSKIDTVPGIGSYVLKYTIGLPWTIKNAIFSGKEEAVITSIKTESNFYNLSEDDYSLLESLSQFISVDVDKKSGLVKLATTMEEPLLSAQLAVAATSLLQQHVIDYKVQKAVDNLIFIQGRYDEAKIAYEQSQKSFFEYKDANRNIILERVDFHYQRLSDDYDVAATVYKGLSQQLEQAKISVKQATPVFKVLEPVVVPIEKSAPKRKIILIVSFLVGCLTGVVLVFLRLILLKYFKYGL